MRLGMHQPSSLEKDFPSNSRSDLSHKEQDLPSNSRSDLSHKEQDFPHSV